MRPKKRGRPLHRTPPALLRSVFLEGFTLRQLASRHRSVSLPVYRYRFRQALDRFVTQPSPQRLPRGPVVLLADGLWFRFHGRPWVLYLTALKPCGGDYAVFLDPQLLAGTERATQWTQALGALPHTITDRVQGLVVDNLPGMRRLASQYGWVLQLCHFHLLLKLYASGRRQPRTLRGGPVREELARLVRTLLEVPDGTRFDQARYRLQQLSRGDCGTRRIQMVVRNALRDLDAYRAYRDHPALGLPRTTNTVESMGRLVREMLRRNRAGSHSTSLLRWATALIRLRPTLTCNGYDINRFS